MAKRFLRTITITLLCAACFAGGTYTVKRGDSLWRISKRYYGQGSKWPRIYNANRHTVRNPNKIRPKQVLVIPGATTKRDEAPPGYVYWKTVRARVTAYCPAKCCCGKYADGKTSTGTNAWVTNGCGVYRRAIPYGTVVKVPGIGYRVADDTGPAMRRSWARGRYHIDLRFRYHWQADHWGRQMLRVKLYKKG